MSLIAKTKKANEGIPTLSKRFSDFFDMDRFFDWNWFDKIDAPAVNIKETPENYEVELAAPGLDKTDFTIAVKNGILTISADQKEENTEELETFTRREFNYRSFKRAFALPADVNEDDVQAGYAEGILKIRLGKNEAIKQAPAREIKVN